MNKRKLTLIIEREIAKGGIRIGNSCICKEICKFYLLFLKKNYTTPKIITQLARWYKDEMISRKNSFDYYLVWLLLLLMPLLLYLIYLYLRNLSPSEWKRIIVIIIIIIIVWLSFFAITLLLFALRSLLFIIVPVQFHWAA